MITRRHKRTLVYFTRKKGPNLTANIPAATARLVLVFICIERLFVFQGDHEFIALITESSTIAVVIDAQGQNSGQGRSINGLSYRYPGLRKFYMRTDVNLCGSEY